MALAEGTDLASQALNWIDRLKETGGRHEKNESGTVHIAWCAVTAEALLYASPQACYTDFLGGVNRLAEEGYELMSPEEECAEERDANGAVVYWGCRMDHADSQH